MDFVVEPFLLLVLGPGVTCLMMIIVHFIAIFAIDGWFGLHFVYFSF